MSPYVYYDELTRYGKVDVESSKDHVRRVALDAGCQPSYAEQLVDIHNLRVFEALTGLPF